MFEVQLDETVAKGPFEDILHETLTAEYVPENDRPTPRRKRDRKPGVCYMSDSFSKVPEPSENLGYIMTDERGLDPLMPRSREKLCKICNLSLEPLMQVDFVLVYDPAGRDHQRKRDIFEEELIRAGLQLDYVQSSQSRGGLMFIKINAPWEVLSTYAEVMHFKMPVKESCFRRQEWQAVKEGVNGKELGESEENERALAASRLSLQPRPTKKMMHKQFAVTFSKTKEYLFDIPEVREEFFSSAQRSQIVNYILQRKKFSRTQTEETFDFGINRLLADMTYLAAFPLHEGSNTEKDHSLRHRLITQWASIISTFRNQPLDDIRRYFGVKVGLYFAWLGFYTNMLIPASLVGIVCFMYGVLTVRTNDPSLDVCLRSKDIVMCPTCDTGCEYWKLEENCKHSMMTYMFDNAATVFFSVFMALWSAAFLELWKRYCSRITYQWDLTGFDTLEENSRPEYVAKMSILKKKLMQEGQENKSEKLTYWKRKLPYTIFSFSVILLAILLCVSAAVGVVLYRMTLRAVLAVQGAGDDAYTPVIVSSTAAFLNLICILLFNMLYSKLAVNLTDMEMPRTQSEYDDSLTLKMYLLQFVNCYSSIFYIALFKGKFVGRPGKYNYVLGSYQQEVCGTGGCFQELSIQLAVIMIGKQAFSAIYEFFWPALMKSLQKKGIRNRTIYIDITPGEDGAQKKMAADGADTDDEKPWERDYCLPEMGQTGLFFEYLEMILQYGFVTLFVAAFPLAPLFALINNVFEIRLDAKKLLLQFRRPVGQRVKDIRVWYRIMDVLGKLSVLSNAVIIAFTSELIPRLYYLLKYNPQGNLVGYVNFTLSYFDTTHYEKGVIHKDRDLLGNSTLCRYSDFRTPPWDNNRSYKRTIVYWEIFVWRLVFVILFENVIVVLTTLIRWLIPDTPRSIREKIREDNRLTNELIILQELKRRQHEREACRSFSR